MKNRDGTFESWALLVLPLPPSFACAGWLKQMPAWPVCCGQQRCRRLVSTHAVGLPISLMERVARHAPGHAILTSVPRDNDCLEPRRAPLAWEEPAMPQSTFMEASSPPALPATRGPGSGLEVALLQGPRLSRDTWTARSRLDQKILAFLGLKIVDRRTCALMDRDEILQNSRLAERLHCEGKKGRGRTAARGPGSKSFPPFFGHSFEVPREVGGV